MYANNYSSIDLFILMHVYKDLSRKLGKHCNCFEIAAFCYPRNFAELLHILFETCDTIRNTRLWGKIFWKT